MLICVLQIQLKLYLVGFQFFDLIVKRCTSVPSDGISCWLKLNLEFDSYIIPTTDLEEGQFRLLEVDHRVVVPMGVEVRMLITSADVIHAWTIPSLGVKVDAVPGRLNQLGFISNRPGVFYGQCSEICGSNHSFIPISLEVVDHITFINWIKKYSEEL